MLLGCRQAPGGKRAGGGGKRSGRSRAQRRGELCLELNAGQASHPRTSPWKPRPCHPASHPHRIVGHRWPRWAKAACRGGEAALRHPAPWAGAAKAAKG